MQRLEEANCAPDKGKRERERVRYAVSTAYSLYCLIVTDCYFTCISTRPSPVPSYSVLSYHVLSYPDLTCHVMSCMSYIVSCPTVSCHVYSVMSILSCHVYSVLSCLFCPAVWVIWIRLSSLLFLTSSCILPQLPLIPFCPPS